MSVRPVYIKGPRLVIRSSEPENTPGFVALFLNEDNWPYDKQPPKETLTVDNREKRIQREVEEREAGKSAFYHLELPDLQDGARMKLYGNMIGCGGFNSIFVEDGKKVIDTGVMIDSSEWRKGYVAEALLITHEYAFDTLGADVVKMETLQANRPMRNLAKKVLGMDGIQCEGGKGPYVLFRMTKDEWLQRSAQKNS